jgi:4-amino-4-deoxy-L-arabinose transferase-like glycosyltransferase
LPRYTGAYQAPGYSVFIAGVLAISGSYTPDADAQSGDDPRLCWVKFAQVLLGTATTFIAYRLGRTWFDHGVGLAAGWFFALDPTLIAFTHYLFTETLFTFLFAWAILLITEQRSQLSTWRSIAAGVLLAFGAYTKSSVLYFLPVLAIWWLWTQRRQWKSALRCIGCATAAWTLCVAPWTIRNWQVHGGLVVIDSSGPFNLWRGNNPSAYKRRDYANDDNVRFPAPFDAFSMAPVSEVGGSNLVNAARGEFETDTPTDLQVMQTASRLSLEFIELDWPGFFHRAWYKVVDTWNPTSFVMRNLGKNGYGDIEPWVASAITWSCVLAYLVTMAFALPAFFLQRKHPAVVLTLLMVLYYTAIHAVSFGLTRFRLPLMPFLTVLAGWTLWSLLERARDRAAKRVRA